MMLYLGSSSLVKLYVREPQSDQIKEWTEAAEIVATSRIAYTEVVSALDIRFKKTDLSAEDYERAVNAFHHDWEHIVRIDFDDREAGWFIKRYGLTRFGALHLSSAKLVITEYEKLRSASAKNGKTLPGLSLFFSSTDETLLRAATAEGLRVLPLV